ncbi:MAG: diguanylate cyclase, partial [Acidobacteriota bacterium]
LLTARNYQKDIIDGLHAVDDDYITKPFDKQELEVRLRTGKRIIELQKELIEARERLRIMAIHDPLTGLYNRGAILEQLQAEFSRARRTSSCMAIVLGDVDHFKSINDTHGHLIGDEVLRTVARRLNESSRDYDAVGRYGGEEFLVLVPNCPPACAFKQASRLHQAIRSRPVESDQGAVSVTISLGVAVCEGRNLPDAETLIHAADEALYRAKEAGRDRVEMGQLEAVRAG